MSRRKDTADLVAALLMALVLIGVIGFGIWARVAGPCSMWSWAPAKDVPARCFMK